MGRSFESQHHRNLQCFLKRHDERGVKRVIYASSGSTVSNCEREFPYNTLVEGRYDEGSRKRGNKLDHNSLTRPSGLYGCTKVFGEALARTLYGYLRHLHNLSAYRPRLPARTVQRSRAPSLSGAAIEILHRWLRSASKRQIV